MPVEIAPAFEREYGCTEAEWLRWLPGAVREHALELAGPSRQARVRIGAGALHLAWTPREPRQIALIRMPRMTVSFAFEGVDAAARAEFMRYFDLYLQRGGG
jgi:hypothetical protein